MSKLDLPYQVTNLSPADATPVQSNFARIEQYSNAELIERDGSVAMNAQLRLIGNPVNALDAAPKQYVDTIIPVGGVIMYTGIAAPVGGIWLVCDGSPVQTATYPTLFAVMGTRFGGSGGFFNLPPLSERFPVGAGANIGVGVQGGAKDAVVVAHTHSINHTHGGTTTGLQSVNHGHGYAGTTAAADRALGTSTNGDHWHQPSNAGEFVTGGGASGGPPQGYMGEAALSPDGSGYVKMGGTGNAGNHSHTVTDHLHSFSGNTGGVNADHNHSIPAIGFTGASAQTGVAAAGTNMPPYVGIIFIVRAA